MKFFIHIILLNCFYINCSEFYSCVPTIYLDQDKINYKIIISGELYISESYCTYLNVECAHKKLLNKYNLQNNDFVIKVIYKNIINNNLDFNFDIDLIETLKSAYLPLDQIFEFKLSCRVGLNIECIRKQQIKLKETINIEDKIYDVDINLTTFVEGDESLLIKLLTDSILKNSFDNCYVDNNINNSISCYDCLCCFDGRDKHFKKRKCGECIIL